MTALVAVALALVGGAYVARPWRSVGGGDDLPHELDGSRLADLLEEEASWQREWSAAAGELVDELGGGEQG